MDIRSYIPPIVQNAQTNQHASGAVDLVGWTLTGLEALLTEWGEPKYRAKQVYHWVYYNRARSFDNLTDLSKPLRQRLSEHFSISRLALEQEKVSTDGTRKYLFRLADGKPIESVLIPDGGRRTLCISSQSGCALACRFCATGTMGLLRNLTVGEILGQVIHLRDQFGEDAFTNIVFMGMGEPLHNFDAVIESIRILSDSLAFNFAAKRITISTSGITPKIKKLAESGLKSRLALSLHAATQEKRKILMPVADTFGLDKLMESIRYYAETTGNRVMFEYIVFDNFNDSAADARALINLIHGIPCKINLLAYNPIQGLGFARPSDEKVDWFAQQLYPYTPAVTVRKSRGLDIDAACGQLAARHPQAA
jgi:23S rRNA (adenine2503-C2)-methyltransferase